jgi:toxin ParE1/3/4
VTGYLISPQARQDLFEISDYIADDNLDAALRLRDRLFAAFGRLATRPGLGHVRGDLVPAEFGVRFWPVGSYLVIYRPPSCPSRSFGF